GRHPHARGRSRLRRRDGTGGPRARRARVLHSREGRAHRSALPEVARARLRRASRPRHMRGPAAVYRRLFPYLGPYWPRLLAGGLLALVVAAGDGAVVYLVKPALDGIFVRRDLTMLRLVPLALLGVYVIKGMA